MSARCSSRASLAPSRRGGCSKPRSARTSRARTTRRSPISTPRTSQRRSRSRSTRRSPRSPRKESPTDSARVEHQLDVRYIGQEYTLTIPLTDANEPATDDFDTAISGRFDEAHDTRFGHANPGAPIEFVAARSTGLGDLTRAAAERLTKTTATADAPQTTRAIVFGRTERDAPVLQRDDLPPGSTQNGPAVIIEATATTVVPPGCTARIDDFGTIVIEIGEEE